MRNCAVYSCKNTSRQENVIFFKFPLRNPDVKEQWIVFTGRPESWRPNSHSVICSEHFTKSMILPGKRTRLKRDALPMEALGTRKEIVGKEEDKTEVELMEQDPLEVVEAIIKEEPDDD